LNSQQFIFPPFFDLMVFCQCPGFHKKDSIYLYVLLKGETGTTKNKGAKCSWIFYPAGARKSGARAEPPFEVIKKNYTTMWWLKEEKKYKNKTSRQVAGVKGRLARGRWDQTFILDEAYLKEHLHLIDRHTPASPINALSRTPNPGMTRHA
jgi:hypothetical protein